MSKRILEQIIITCIVKTMLVFPSCFLGVMSREPDILQVPAFVEPARQGTPLNMNLGGCIGEGPSERGREIYSQVSWWTEGQVSWVSSIWNVNTSLRGKIRLVTLNSSLQPRGCLHGLGLLPPWNVNRHLPGGESLEFSLADQSCIDIYKACLLAQISGLSPIYSESPNYVETYKCFLYDPPHTQILSPNKANS